MQSDPDRGRPQAKRPRAAALVFLGASWRVAKDVQDVIGVVDVPDNLSEFRCVVVQVLRAIDLGLGDIIFLLLLLAMAFWPEIHQMVKVQLSSRTAKPPSVAPVPASSRIEVDVEEETSRLMLSGPSWFLFLNTVVLVKQDDSAYIDSISASWDETRECRLLTPNESSFGLQVIPPHGPIPSIRDSHAPTSAYLIFACGHARTYARKSIFDGLFNVRIKFTDGPTCECWCRALRLPEGVPGRDSAFSYDIEVLRPA